MQTQGTKSRQKITVDCGKEVTLICDPADCQFVTVTEKDQSYKMFKSGLIISTNCAEECRTKQDSRSPLKDEYILIDGIAVICGKRVNKTFIIRDANPQEKVAELKSILCACNENFDLLEQQIEQVSQEVTASAWPDYSTQEVAIPRKFIDGKQVYEMTFRISGFASGDGITHNANVDNYLNVYGSTWQSGNPTDKRGLSPYASAQTVQNLFYIGEMQTDGFDEIVTDNLGNFDELLLVMQYTKL